MLCVAIPFALPVLLSLAAAPAWAQQPPGVPRNVAAGAGDRSITISWDEPANAGTGVDGYEVQRKPTAGSDWLTTSHPSQLRQFTFDSTRGITNGVQYDMRVRSFTPIDNQDRRDAATRSSSNPGPCGDVWPRPPRLSWGSGSFSLRIRDAGHRRFPLA